MVMYFWILLLSDLQTIINQNFNKTTPKEILDSPSSESLFSVSVCVSLHAVQQ